MKRTDSAAIRATLTDPVAIANALGFSRIKRQQRGVTVCCPLHNERTPSCSITRGPDGTLRFRCFGCQATGDLFSLIAAVHGISTASDFPRVVELAESIFGIHPEATPHVAMEPPEPSRLNDEIFARIPLDPLSGDVLEYVLSRLQGADISGLYQVPREFSEQACAAVGSEAWMRTGLASISDHRLATFRANRLAIPWWRPDGIMHTLQRRRITPGEPKYVFPSHRAPRFPYGVERVIHMSAGAAVVFVEGALDTIAFRALAAREAMDCCVLGLPGVGGWERSWAIYAAGRDAVIALDSDAAGEARIASIASDLRQAGACRVTRAKSKTHDWSDDLVASWT